MSDPSLRTPGLQLRSLEPEALPLTRTALTAFVGVTERGPLDSPQIVRSFGDFVTVFGDVWRYGAVGESVYGFFLNGGEEAAIVRVGRQPPLPVPAVPGCAAKEELATAAAAASVVDANGKATLRLTARNPGAWGNRLEVEVSAESEPPVELGKLSKSANGGAGDIIVENVYDYRVGAEVRITHASNPFLKSTHQISAINESLARLTLVQQVPSHGYPAGSSLVGRGFRLIVRDGARREMFDGLSMNPRHSRFFVDVVNGPANLPYLDLARLGHSVLVVAAQELGATGESRFKPVNAVATVRFEGGGDGLTFSTGTLSDAAAAATLVGTARVSGRGGEKITLTATPFRGRLSLAVPPETGASKAVLVLEDIRGWVAGEPVKITHATSSAINEPATILNVDKDRHELRLTSPVVNDYPLGSTIEVAAATARFNLTVQSPAGSPRTEVFFNLSMDTGARSFSTVVNGAGGSQLVCLSAVPAGTVPTGATELKGGTDPDEVPLPAFTGYGADGSFFQPAGATGPVGMAALETVAAVNLVAVPDLVRRADLTPEAQAQGQTLALHHCQKMGERFAVLDVPAKTEPAGALQWPEHFADPRSVRYGALYYPWLQMSIAGRNRLLPPSGVMAGVFARVDQQAGVERAPANVQLKGVVGLERDVDAIAQGALNEAGVNCVRKFEVGAVRLWGARTLSRDDQYSYVHNRRVVLLVIKGLATGLRWAVFEPNEAGLQKRVKAAITGVLQSALARGLPSGGRVEDAFFVNVGDDLNTAATREAGQFFAEVGIAVAKPAEFIVISVKRTPDILTLVEEEA